MENAVAVAELRCMPFAQLVGNQPLYALVEELKGENPQNFRLILPVLITFRTQAAFMHVIFKRYNTSEI